MGTERGHAIRTLEQHGVGLGSDEATPNWKKEARELMAGLRNQFSEDRSRWAGENAARREEAREFMAGLRAEFGHGRPTDRVDMEQVDCGYCAAQGSLPGTAKCPVCWGKGKLRIRAPYQKCDLCRGTGHVPGMALTCSKCQGKGWMHVQERSNACPRCGGDGLEPAEEWSLAALRERRRKGLPPPPRGTARPACALCQGTGVAYPETRTSLLGLSQASGAAQQAVPLAEGAEPEPSEEQSAETRANVRHPLALEEKVLGYIMSYPGVKPEDTEAILDLSESELDAALQSLVESGRLYRKRGLYYPTPSASRGPHSPKVSAGAHRGQMKAVSRAEEQDA